MLHQALKLAQQTATEQGEKYKFSYDKKSGVHKFSIGQKVWLSDTTSIGKNAKLSPTWIGPYEIVDVNDTNAKLKIKNEVKIVNIARMKPFVEEATKCLSQDDSHSFQGNQCLPQDDPGLSQDQLDQRPSRPMTRAFKKLIDLKNAASMAIAMLQDVDQEECEGNIFSEIYNKNHCKNCYNGIKNFLRMPILKQFLQKHYVGPMCSTELISAAAEENLIKNDVDPENDTLSTGCNALLQANQ
jgi:hypothetical protein